MSLFALLGTGDRKTTDPLDFSDWFVVYIYVMLCYNLWEINTGEDEAPWRCDRRRAGGCGGEIMRDGSRGNVRIYA